jgi:AcrR family transcriptional regulator
MSSGNPETRKHILEVAWHLMVEGQGQAISVDDIARMAKVSRQAIYLHFGTRANLLIATVRYVDEIIQLDERLAKVCAGTRGVEILEGMVEFWGNYIPEIYGLAKALLAVYDTDKDAAAAWNDRMAALRRGCHIAILLLQQEGNLSGGWELEQAASMMWSLLAISVWENLTIHQGWSNEQYVRQMQEVMRRTFVV